VYDKPVSFQNLSVMQVSDKT